MVVNHILTRKCNRRCASCGIVHDPLCVKYKKINEINSKELSFSKVLDNVKNINNHFGADKVFHIFYGGEPFVKPGFDEFLKQVNELGNVKYTVITNATLVDEVVRVRNYAGKYNGLSCSLDPLVMDESNELNDVKNNDAVVLMKHNQSLDLTDDMVVECVFDNQNIKYTEAFMDFMHDNFPEVSISLSVYDYPKNAYYDFASNPGANEEFMKKMRLDPSADNVKDAFNIIRKGIKSGKYNIHMGGSEKFINLIESTCNSSYMCAPVRGSKNDMFTTLTIDANGELRLCLRIAGNVNMYANDVFTSNTDDTNKNIKQLASSLLEEQETKCSGCAWSCMMMDTFWDETVDLSHGQ